MKNLVEKFQPFVKVYNEMVDEMDIFADNINGEKDQEIIDCIGRAKMELWRVYQYYQRKNRYFESVLAEMADNPGEWYNQ